MGSLDQEMVNSRRGQERRWWKRLRRSPQRNVNRDVDILKVGESDMPFKANLQMWGAHLVGAHSDHHGAAPVAGLGYESKCRVGFDSRIDMFISCISVDESRFEEGSSRRQPWRTKSLNQVKSMIRPNDRRW
jgi:hypothetical protein